LIADANDDGVLALARLALALLLLPSKRRSFRRVGGTSHHSQLLVVLILTHLPHAFAAGDVLSARALGRSPTHFLFPLSEHHLMFPLIPALFLPLMAQAQSTTASQVATDQQELADATIPCRLSLSPTICVFHISMRNTTDNGICSANYLPSSTPPADDALVVLFNDAQPFSEPQNCQFVRNE
jgi:hypothetical protein